MEDFRGLPLPVNRSYLSFSEIKSYLKNVLHIDLDTEPNPAPSLELLKKIYLNYAMYVPYSTVRFLPIPIPKRDLPSIEDVRNCGLNNLTGVCYETNIFLSWVLIGLGYKVSYLLGKVYRFNYGAAVNQHTFFVVHHEGEDYMLDPGAGVLIAPNLISLNFAKTSPIYSASLWDFQYHKEIIDGVEKISGAFRWTEATAFPNVKLPLIKPECEWAIYTEFERKYLALEDLEEVMRNAHKNPKIATVTTRLYVYQFPEGRMKLMRNKRFFWEVEGRKKCEKICETKEEVLETLLEHFGQFYDRETAAKAVDAYFEFNDAINKGHL